MYIGLAFNERDDAFDFNATLEDIKKERNYATFSAQDPNEVASTPKDYSIKEGEKIHISIPKRQIRESNSSDSDINLFPQTSATIIHVNEKPSTFYDMVPTFLKNNKTKALAPSRKDTPSRVRR